uniref:Uncharacterized protein n=1 Tax=Arundo donax TaxID=35708 RepID=A0A0A9EST7_ARUDO
MMMGLQFDGEQSPNHSRKHQPSRDFKQKDIIL